LDPFDIGVYLFAASSGVLAAAYYFRPGRKKETRWWSGIVVEGKRVKVRTDQDLCMGASSCVSLAPEVFHIDWDKKKSFFDPAPLVVANERPPNPERVFKAAQSCPYKAIILEDAETDERLYP